MYRPFLSASRLTALGLVLGLLSLSACQSIPTQAETTSLASLPRTLTVSGKGSVTIPTTMTQVRLGVEVQGKTAQEVQQQVAQRSQAVVELLKARNVAKLETKGISLNPNYSYKDGRQSIVGYIGNNTVSFRIETEKSGTLLDEAIKAGGTKIEGVSFVASDDAIAQAQQDAIQRASQDAKKQADAALSALDLKQREVVSIQINNANPPQPVPYGAPMMEAAQLSKDRANTPVVAAEQKVEQTVTLQIRY